ncbi:MAG TPA: hypothetical protein VHW23_45655 [Kofleriaceae bacterium]|jgi:hypothetical protein|nr:hypothetical protein [Kofleriaceae bacterium]
MIARLAVMVSLGAAGLAHADAKPPSATPPAPEPGPVDPAVETAADANLESTADRQGFTGAVSVGGGLTVGFGIDGSTGRGGSVDFRIGHVATPHTVITFELGATISLHKPAMNAATDTNTDTNLLAGAQYYVSPSLWLRFAGGLGVYQANDVRRSDGTLGDVQRIGPAVLGGVGLDIARFKWAVLGVEIGTSAMINGGVLIASDLRVGLAID